MESEKAGEYNRTTSMLVAVVLCFVVTELPQGVLAFLGGTGVQAVDTGVQVPDLHKYLAIYHKIILRLSQD